MCARSRHEATFLPLQFNLFHGLFERAPALIIDVGRGYHIS
jgi:hypothetical protein